MSAKVKVKVITVERYERIIAVVPEVCRGPGWVNQPVWVYIQRADKTLRTECIQPDEQTAEMRVLFSLGAMMQSHLLGALNVRNVP